MIAIRRVFVYEFRRNGRRSGYLFMSIGIPLIAIVLFFGFVVMQRIATTVPHQTMPNVANPTAIDKPIGIVDQTPQHIIVASTLSAQYQLLPDANAATLALQAGELSSYVLIPVDYISSGTIEFWLPRFSTVFSLTSQSDISSMLRKSMVATTTGINSDALARLTETAPNISNHMLDNANQVNQTADFGSSYALIYLFALALVASTFLTSGYLMQAVMEERQNRVIEVLMASLRPNELLAGKVLALGALSLLQMMAWATVSYFLIKQIAPLSPGLAGLDINITQLAVLLIFFLLGYLMYAAVYAAIGTIANSLREGPQFAVFFTLPAMLPLYLSTVFTLQPDGTLAVLLSLFPITAPLAMVMRIAISPVPVWQIILSAALLLSTGVGFMWIAGRLFRLTVLLAGQTPRLREIPKLLRQSL